METEIYFLLHSLGIGAKYRGFRYLAYGIALCMEDEDYLLRVPHVEGVPSFHYLCTATL